jgi:hypothetical protein
MLDNAVVPHQTLRGSTWVTVCCPQCGKSTSMKCPLLVLHVALHRWHQMNLYAACCDVYWGASEAEIRAIRESL